MKPNYVVTAVDAPIGNIENHNWYRLERLERRERINYWLVTCVFKSPKRFDWVPGLSWQRECNLRVATKEEWEDLICLKWTMSE